MELRALINERLEEVKIKLKDTNPFFQGKPFLLDKEDYEIFFENWKYSAINIICSIPKYQKVEAICEYYNLPRNEVLRILNFLVEKGMLEKVGDRFIRELKLFYWDFLPDVIKSKHHYNWRVRALNAIDKTDEINTHKTIVTSLSNKNIHRVKKAIFDNLYNILEEIEGDPRDEVVSICLDFFKVE